MTLKSVPVRLSRGWVFSFDSQWPAVFRPAKFAWTDFTFIQVEIEHERAMDNWNATVCILGFCFYVSYSYHDSVDDSIGDK